MFLVCVTVGLVFLASKYRENVLHSMRNLCHTISNSRSSFSNSNKNNNKLEDEKNNIIALDKIILADSPEKCDYAVQRLRW